MNISSVQKLCIHLTSSAFQRCRFFEDLCRLSVVLERSITNPPIIRVSISDTGTGSCLEEFQDLKYSSEDIGIEKWDGLLSIKTTSISDNTIYHYRLNFGESASARRLTRLPPIPKNDAKFSGTEVCLSISDTVDALVTDIKRLFEKMLILKIPSVAAELVTELGDAPGLRSKNVFLPNECDPLNFSSSNVERLKSGLGEYVLKHGNSLNNKCDSCFCSRVLSSLLLHYLMEKYLFEMLLKGRRELPSLREQLKISSGVACSIESHRSPGLTVEAVIAISELSESPCFRSCSNKTEVLHFKDFSPCSVSVASLRALTSIDWRSYGLTLGSIVDQVDHALIEWENLPPNLHIDMVIHSYHKQVTIYPGKCKYQPERHLIKKAMKLALDDLKEKYTGFLLSAHAVKICSYAPDLASSIAGIILSSNDSEFQNKCASLLELSQSQGIGQQTIEDCIKEKIISVIEKNDRKHEKSKEAAPILFEDDSPQDLEPVPYLEEYEGGDDIFSFPD